MTQTTFTDKMSVASEILLRKLRRNSDRRTSRRTDTKINANRTRVQTQRGHSTRLSLITSTSVHKFIHKWARFSRQSTSATVSKSRTKQEVRCFGNHPKVAELGRIPLTRADPEKPPPPPGLRKKIGQAGCVKFTFPLQKFPSFCCVLFFGTRS